MAELQESPLLDPDGNAATCLGHLATNVDSPRLDPDRWEDGAWEWQDDVAEELRNLSAVRDAVWLAFGEILHGAEGAPEAPATPRLPAPEMLRIVRLKEESTPEKVRGTLLYFQEMFEKGDVSVFPAQVIFCLSGAIKALVRRVWGEKFTETHPEPKVSTVLQERLQHGDDLERRFASLAMHLYKAYRIPSQHEFERFECSLAEALHFFLGIRILLEFSDAIEGGGRRGD
ncbi:MAG TPA: hypothetical protein VFW87_11825 [Pirellulales bacterium]|nr:hypothetical protein [Pirellulales bacterium]